MTLRDLCSEGEQILAESGVDDAALDARLLLLEAFSLDLNGYLTTRDAEVPEDEATAAKTACYRGFIRERARRVPLQRIVGSTEFMGLTFSVKENVLIPRQDTETLVGKVLADYAGNHAAAADVKTSVTAETICATAPETTETADAITSGTADSLLDLCTGSGCIAVSLAVKGDFSRVAATDISKEAIDAARENAARYHLSDIEFYEGDLFSALPRETPPFSVITANPPYIPTGDIAGLQPEVRDYDPVSALDGSVDGLLFYRRIAAEAPPYLERGGRIYVEIGADQALAVCDIFKAAGFNDIEVTKDLSGKDRVVSAGSPVG